MAATFVLGIVWRGTAQTLLYLDDMAAVLTEKLVVFASSLGIQCFSLDPVSKEGKKGNAGRKGRRKGGRKEKMKVYTFRYSWCAHISAHVHMYDYGCAVVKRESQVLALSFHLFRSSVSHLLAIAFTRFNGPQAS